MSTIPTNLGSLVELRPAFDIALTLIAFLGGWFVKTLRDDIHELKQSDDQLKKVINDLRVELPTHYVSKAELQLLFNNIHDVLRRIEDKLDKKADK